MRKSTVQSENENFVSIPPKEIIHDFDFVFSARFRQNVLRQFFALKKILLWSFGKQEFQYNLQLKLINEYRSIVITRINEGSKP
jgi:hypothetical protein